MQVPGEAGNTTLINSPISMIECNSSRITSRDEISPQLNITNGFLCPDTKGYPVSGSYSSDELIY